MDPSVGFPGSGGRAESFFVELQVLNHSITQLLNHSLNLNHSIPQGVGIDIVELEGMMVDDATGAANDA